MVFISARKTKTDTYMVKRAEVPKDTKNLNILAKISLGGAREPAEVPGLGFWAFWGPRAVDQLGTHLN